MVLALLAPQSRHGDKTLGVKLGKTLKTNKNWKGVKYCSTSYSIEDATEIEYAIIGL